MSQLQFDGSQTNSHEYVSFSLRNSHGPNLNLLGITQIVFLMSEQQDKSLIAAIEGDFSGMAHSDLVLTCKMLTNGRAQWRQEAEGLRTALQRLKGETDALFTLATDAIIHDSEGWHCKSCGMELDTGGTHKADCCASRILDLNHALYFAEEALKRAQA